MATRTQKAKVGLFLVICVLLIAGGILLISGYRHEARVYYWTQFNESVLGLSSNSVVTYLGVPVGSVSNIYVTDENAAHVDMEIIVDKVTLRPGVEAKLVLYSLATGTLAVGLSGGDSSAPMLPPGSEIPSTPSLVETVSSQIEALLNNLNETIDRFNELLGAVDDGQVQELVENTAGVMENVRQFTEKATEFMDSLSEAADGGIEDFRGLMKTTQEVVETTGEAVEALQQQIAALDMGETTIVLNRALESIEQLAQRLQETATAVERTGEGAEHSIQNIQLNMREMIETLNESLIAVRDLAEYLRQDPSALIRGRGRPRGD